MSLQCQPFNQLCFRLHSLSYVHQLVANLSFDAWEIVCSRFLEQWEWINTWKTLKSLGLSIWAASCTTHAIQLASRPFQICREAHQWRASLWLAGQRSQSEHKKRNGKRKGKSLERVALAPTISSVQCDFSSYFTSASRPLHLTYSRLLVAVLARVLSENTASSSSESLSQAQNERASWPSAEEFALCSSAAVVGKRGNTTVGLHRY